MHILKVSRNTQLKHSKAGRRKVSFASATWFECTAADCVVNDLSVMCLLQLMLSSDEDAFGGFENLSKKYNTEFASSEADYDGRPHNIQVGHKACGRVCIHFATFSMIGLALESAEMILHGPIF